MKRTLVEEAVTLPTGPIVFGCTCPRCGRALGPCDSLTVLRRVKRGHVCTLAGRRPR